MAIWRVHNAYYTKLLLHLNLAVILWVEFNLVFSSLSYSSVAHVSRSGSSVPISGTAKPIKQSHKAIDITVFSTGQVIIKILEVPFAKLAFKTLLPNVIMFLPFIHCVIFLQVGFVYDKKSAFFLKKPGLKFQCQSFLRATARSAFQ